MADPDGVGLDVGFIVNRAALVFTVSFAILYLWHRKLLSIKDQNNPHSPAFESPLANATAA
jgi:hypothetical protein